MNTVTTAQAARTFASNMKVGLVQIIHTSAGSPKDISKKRSAKPKEQTIANAPTVASPVIRSELVAPEKLTLTSMLA